MLNTSIADLLSSRSVFIATVLHMWTGECELICFLSVVSFRCSCYCRHCHNKKRTVAYQVIPWFSTYLEFEQLDWQQAVFEHCRCYVEASSWHWNLSLLCSIRQLALLEHSLLCWSRQLASFEHCRCRVEVDSWHHWNTVAVVLK